MSAPEPAPLDEASESDEYFIAKSVGQIGHLYPVLKDAQGNVIDGVHRLNIDSKWPSRTVEEVKDATQLVIARLIANVCRRTVPREEKTEWLRQIATLTGRTPRQIAENLPVSYNWVMKYIPDEFKERPGQGPMEYPVTRRVTESQKPVARLATQAISCARCGTATNEPVHLEGKFYCALCAEKQVAEKKERAAAADSKEQEEREHEPLEHEAEERKPAQPEPVLTGFEVECPECHRKLLINHKRWPDGREKHEIEAET
jgi:DNA-directed RNA polymerase subunit M/transcription elongation factor TFIIS